MSRASGANVYVRAGGGSLWHVQRSVTQHGSVNMLCGMMATGRCGHERRFDRFTSDWPTPRCPACEQRATGNPKRTPFRPTVEVAFPDGRGETTVIVTIGSRVAALAFSLKAASNGIKVYGPAPTRVETTLESEGRTGRVSHYEVRS